MSLALRWLRRLPQPGAGSVALFAVVGDEPYFLPIF